METKVDQNMFVELEVPRPRLATSHLGNETKGRTFAHVDQPHVPYVEYPSEIFPRIRNVYLTSEYDKKRSERGVSNL